MAEFFHGQLLLKVQKALYIAKASQLPGEYYPPYLDILGEYGLYNPNYMQIGLFTPYIDCCYILRFLLLQHH